MEAFREHMKSLEKRVRHLQRRSFFRNFSKKRSKDPLIQNFSGAFGPFSDPSLYYVVSLHLFS